MLDGPRVVRHADGTVVAIDAGVVRLSDPASTAIAIAVADDTADETFAMVRGPVEAADAFVARRRDMAAWKRIFEGIEMAAIGDVSTRDVRGAMQPAGETFASWRAAFIAEVFAGGGSPPAVPPDRLFAWVVDGTPRSMAGLLPLGDDAARVVTVYTPPAERGRGYAAVLAAALVEHARGSGVELVTLDVSIDDPHARRAYERAGFRGVGRHAVWLRCG